MTDPEPNGPVSYRPKSSEIPVAPGVYRFQDENHRVLYVGKAKNLRARLANYFAPLPSLHERTRRMVTTAASVEWTVVANEYEALQLEYTWIKEFDPPFNVQFRDDKSYPYLAITRADEVPRALITRNRNIPGARYFGPYTKVWAIRETLDLLLKVFPMRSCTPGVYRRAELTGRPCLLADIGKCAAPCVGRISKQDHLRIVDDLVAFMGGGDRRAIAELRAAMATAAAKQDYESAARHRDSLHALETVMEKTAVVLSDRVDADLFGLAEDELAAAVQQFIVRGGRIRGVRGWIVDKELNLDRGELIESVLQNVYGDGELTPPRDVLVPELPDDATELAQWLTERRQDAIAGEESTAAAGRVTIRVPQRGEKAKLAATAELNAGNALVLYKTRRSADFTARSQALTDLQRALGMVEAPLRIECFDVSHLAGTDIVASMVVFEDGLPRKDQYRRFSIPVSSDDTESIRQVVSRRLAHLARDTETAAPRAEAITDPVTPVKFAYRPQLVLVDGGQPQVKAAQAALDASGVTGIQLAGIAKRLEELWLPDDDYPVILPRNSDALFLVQRVRDEAHRFAISYQRARRSRGIATVLSEIPGLGPVRVKSLLRHFGSVTRLKAASPEELAGVTGIGPRLGALIHEHLSS